MKRVPGNFGDTTPNNRLLSIVPIHHRHLWLRTALLRQQDQAGLRIQLPQEGVQARRTAGAGVAAEEGQHLPILLHSEDGAQSSIMLCNGSMVISGSSRLGTRAAALHQG